MKENSNYEKMNTIHRRIVTCGCVLLFFFMFLLNYLSLFTSDDFEYMYSFADGSRIESIADIVHSMAAHAQTVNGRLVAHFLVQFFAMLPPIIFDALNALAFVVYIASIYRLAVGKTENAWLLGGVLSVVWLYQPGFSDVILWQDGAINYLWAIAFGFVFIRVYIQSCFNQKTMVGRVKRGAFLIFSLLFGAYSENISFACIVMAIASVAGNWILNKKKPDMFLLLGIVLAGLGYVTIYLAPAQWSNKAVGLSIVSMLTSFVNAIVIYRSFGLLCVAFVVLLVLNLFRKSDKKLLLLAGVFLLGSLAANFIMTFAVTYPKRSATGAFAFLLAADVLLLRAWLPCLENKREILVCMMAILMVVTIPAGAEAVRDIGKTYLEIRENEAYIEQCKAKGILDIELPTLTKSRSKYSIGYGNGYVYLGDPNNGHNRCMAKYYGVDSISGIVIPERVLDASAYE